MTKKVDLNNIEVIDSTLREGRQNQFSFLLADKEIEYLSAITKLGIKNVELSHPSSSDYWRQIYTKIKQAELSLNLYVHTRAKKENLNLLDQLDGISHLSVFVERKDLNKQKPKKMISDQLKDFMNSANQKGYQLRLGIENCFGIRPQLLAKLYKKLADYPGVTRISFLDTYGRLIPEELNEYLQIANEIIDNRIEFEFHFHNDFGLAMTNFHSVIQSGLSKNRKLVFSVSLGGIGERNGILSLGGYLGYLYRYFPTKVNKKYQLNKYGPMVKLIKENHQFFGYHDPLSPNSFHHQAQSHLERIAKKNYPGTKGKVFGYEDFK